MSYLQSIDYSVLAESLSEDEVALLSEYQTLALTLMEIKVQLENLNNQFSTNDLSSANVKSLSDKAFDLQQSLTLLSTSFKSTVHNVLTHVQSNQLDLKNDYDFDEVDLLANNSNDLMDVNGDDEYNEENMQHIVDQAYKHSINNANQSSNKSKSSGTGNNANPDADVDLEMDPDSITVNILQHELEMATSPGKTSKKKRNEGDENGESDDEHHNTNIEADIHNQIANQFHLNNQY